MILVIREDGKALNLDTFETFADKKTPTGPTHLQVGKRESGPTYLVEDYSLQDLIDYCSGRFGAVQIIRRNWRPWQTSDARQS